MNNNALILLASCGLLVLFSDQIIAGAKWAMGAVRVTRETHSDHKSFEEMVSCYLSDPANEGMADAVRSVVKEVASYCYLKELEEGGIIK